MTVVLTVSAQGDMTLDDRPIAADALQTALESRMKQGEPFTLLIRAEPMTSIDKVGLAMTAAGEAGISVVSFNTDLPPPPHAAVDSASATR